MLETVIGTGYIAMPVYLAFTVKLVPRENKLARVVTEEGQPVFNENFGAPYAAKWGRSISRSEFPARRRHGAMLPASISGPATLSGTLDYYVRGYDLQTGEEIWRDRLPVGGQATPST